MAIPADAGLKLTKEQKTVNMLKRNTISLWFVVLYLSLKTRPYIVLSSNYAARFQSKPTSQHLTVVKCILRYLRETTHHGLSFKSDRSK